MSNQLHEPFLSPYTSNHSTETALLMVSDDILGALDNGNCVYVVLLDLSAAFDMMDQLLSCLSSAHGRGLWYVWVCGRMDEVLPIQPAPIHLDKWESIRQNFTGLWSPTGISQWTIGIQTLHQTPHRIAQKHNIQIHLYADDTRTVYPLQPRTVRGGHGAIGGVH